MPPGALWLLLALLQLVTSHVCTHVAVISKTSSCSTRPAVDPVLMPRLWLLIGINSRFLLLDCAIPLYGFA